MEKRSIILALSIDSRSIGGVPNNVSRHIKKNIHIKEYILYLLE